MADGDSFDNSKTLAKYLDNKGVSYRRKIPNGYYTQAGLGWTAGSDADPLLPKGLRLRHVTLRGGDPVVHRKAIVATTAALAAITLSTTTFASDVASTILTLTSKRLEGEHSIGLG